jgi:hypothetical protein
MSNERRDRGGGRSGRARTSATDSALVFAPGVAANAPYSFALLPGGAVFSLFTNRVAPFA